ncbi:hypothetical protein F4821DRAFT_222517 [Hypoxylon rubiginosum]|uniref:Uncharacterized protein n=1 Tax=Hypoxylon rubiginosum TaxID=110542 RepID=A0ACC0DLL8_9PEZI|nr:hypothetical protein F4821DRAFT_222517 [Hypoxylon rubiginosum]
MPSLLTIPLEILLQTSSYLEVEDFGAFRLTCKYIEDSLFSTFIRHYLNLNERPFSCVEFRLQALIDISKSRLSPYLKHVVIASELLPAVYAPDHIDIDTSDPEDLEAILGDVEFLQQRADQKVFLNTGQYQMMLVEAFCNLNHLEKVVIQDNDQCFRDSTLLDNPGGRNGVEYLWSIKRISHASCLQNVLYALGKSGARPKQLDILFSKDFLSDDAFNLPSFMEEAVLPVLANIEALYITSPQLRERVVVCPEQKLRKIRTYYTRKFLARLPQIKHLHIHGFYGVDDDYFVEWLSGPTDVLYDGPRVLQPPASPAFANLYKLELTDCSIYPNDLLALVQKFSTTLRELCLGSMTFFIMPGPSEWPVFAAQLVKAGRHLEKIYFESVTLFMEDFNTMKKWDFSYAGNKMEEALHSLADVMEGNYECSFLQDDDDEGN